MMAGLPKEESMQNRFTRMIFMVIAISSVIVPVIINIKFNSSFIWTISIIFPLLVIVLYPYWKWGLTALFIATSIKYSTELVFNSDTFRDELPSLTTNSIVHSIIFLLIAYLSINSRETGLRLKESEERYKSLFEYNSNMIYSMDVNGKIINGNPTFEKVTGYTGEELSGTSFVPLIVPDYLESTEENFKTAVNGAAIRYESAIFHKDGHLIPLMVTNVPIIVNDEIVGVYGAAIDLTDSKKAEKALKESEERYRKVVELSPKGIIIQRDGVILYANPAALKIVKEEQAIGKSVTDYMLPEYQQLSKERIAQTTSEKEVLPFVEFKLVRKDRKVIDIEVNSTTINYEGDLAILTLFRDITERKRLEEDLNESLKNLEDLKFALDESSIIAITDQKGVIESVNDKFCEISKYAEAELIGQDHRILNSHYHPKEFFKEMWKTIGNGQTWQGEIRNRAKDGGDYWVHTTIVPFLNKKGKPYQYISIRNDITERKKAEDALRESEEQYRLIADNMTDLVCNIDGEGSFKYASPSHETVLGFPAEVYQGELARNWMHEDDQSQVWKVLEEVIMTKESQVFQFRFKNKDASWIWLEGKATPIYDIEGEFQHFLVVSREITERKMFEEKLTYMAYHDTLTGLPNRRFFTERLDQAIKEAGRYKRKFALMYMDMDKFKHINDTLGHDVGDELLVQFAQRVKECLREVDIIARLGGDEFTILLSEIQEEKDAITIADRILYSFEEPWHIGEHIFNTTSSIGIALYPSDGINRNDLMVRADTALYKAKEDGRNNYKMYSYPNE
jgi:diguanylate cyclase (GGDEF)-like protein/PAS domain S-box-containing protein